MIELTQLEFTKAFGVMHSIYSAEWSMGGYFRCCWDEDDHPIDEEHEPEHIDYLIDQLKKTFGSDFDINILQLEYSEDTYSEYDWYGGEHKYGSKSITVAEIYSALIESRQLKIVG